MKAELFFIIPIVSGYFFASQLYYTSFKVAREDGQRLYLRSVFYGIIFFIAGSLAYLAIKLHEYLLGFWALIEYWTEFKLDVNSLSGFWHSLFPFLSHSEQPYLIEGVVIPCILSLPVAVLSLVLFGFLFMFAISCSLAREKGNEDRQKRIRADAGGCHEQDASAVDFGQ